jgi:hypothetical protein
LDVFDEIAFRQAAAANAAGNGESQEEANKFLDPEACDLTGCATMIFDTDISPAGYRIIETTVTNDSTFADKLAELSPDDAESDI